MTFFMVILFLFFGLVPISFSFFLVCPTWDIVAQIRMGSF